MEKVESSLASTGADVGPHGLKSSESHHDLSRAELVDSSDDECASVVSIDVEDAGHAEVSGRGPPAACLALKETGTCAAPLISIHVVDVVSWT